MTGSHHRHMFNLSRNWQTLLQQSGTMLHCYIPITSVQEFQFLHIFPKIWNGHLLLLFSHSTRCVGYPPLSSCLHIQLRLHSALWHYSFSVQFSRVRLSATPWTVARQAPLSVGFSRQEYWSRLPFPALGDLPDPGIKLASSALTGRFFTAEPLGKSWTSILFKHQ